jgi:hypothetical protein
MIRWVVGGGAARDAGAATQRALSGKYAAEGLVQPLDGEQLSCNSCHWTQGHQYHGMRPKPLHPWTLFRYSSTSPFGGYR